MESIAYRLKALEEKEASGGLTVQEQREMSKLKQTLYRLNTPVLQGALNVNFDRIKGDGNYGARIEFGEHTVHVYMPDFSTVAVIKNNEWRKYDSLDTLSLLMQQTDNMEAVFEAGEHF